MHNEQSDFETTREKVLDLFTVTYRGIVMDARAATRWDIRKVGTTYVHWDEYNVFLHRKREWMTNRIRPLVEPFVNRAQRMPFYRAFELMVEGIDPRSITDNGIDASLLESLMNG